MTIGERISIAINKSDFSVKEVSEKLNTTTQNLYKLFKKDSIDSKYLESIADVLGLSPSFFFDKNNFKKGLTLPGPDNSPQAQIKSLKREIKSLENSITDKDKYISALETIAEENKKLKETNVILENFVNQVFIELRGEYERADILNNLQHFSPGNFLKGLFEELSNRLKDINK